MINYSYYPFLDGAQRDIKELDEQTILYARDHIDKYSPTKLEDIDISVFLASTIMLHNLKNNFLIKKFVTNYGKLMESHLKKDIKDKALRTELLKYFDIDKDIKQIVIIQKVEFIKIHVMDYLEISQNISDNQPQFELVNQVLEKGYVVIELQKFVYLVRLVVEQKLYDKIKSGMKDYYGDERINEIVNKLGGTYPETTKRISVKGVNNSVPESIKELIDKAYREHHLSHSERRKIGIYLQAQNYDEDYILDIFRQCSDFDLKTTTYQLKSLRKYIKP